MITLNEHYVENK